MQSLSKRARSTTLVILWIISPETKTMKNNVVVLVLKTIYCDLEWMLIESKTYILLCFVIDHFRQ